ncbi:MAG: diacylglycerol/lipid kinase family protein [Thermoplasmata archaeon]
MRLVVNPMAAGGRVARDWPEVEPRLRDVVSDLEVVFTTGPGSAATLVGDAVRMGGEDIGIVGGDGSVNEALNGLIREDALVDPGVRLTILPVGSGTDYARTLGLPRGLAHAPSILASPTFRPVDVGRCESVDLQGIPRTRYFANILEAGSGGEVVARVNRSAKPFGGQMAFLTAILATLLTYRNKLIRVEVDDVAFAEGRMNGAIVANGRYFGSGLQPAPAARLDDGLLDVVIFGDVSLGEALGSMGKLRRGEHLDHPKVSYTRGRSVRATSEETVLVEMDGELVGILPMQATLLPGLLPVRVLAA